MKFYDEQLQERQEQIVRKRKLGTQPCLIAGAADVSQLEGRCENQYRYAAYYETGTDTDRR